MKELERTFLARFLPEGLDKCEHEEITDVFIPSAVVHPVLRIRKRGDRFEMTKKEPVREGDSSVQEEQTIMLSEEEFQALSGIEGKRFRKIRYYYETNGRTAEIDVFRDALEGLVMVDFEFGSEEEKDSFKPPDFCLVDVTQEEFLAGGMLCGKRYGDIEQKLLKLGYSRLSR